MHEYFKDIVIDGKLNSEKFNGIALNIDKNILRRLIVYKNNFSDSYKKINDLLFKRKCGMNFSHLKFYTESEKAMDYAADIMYINPCVTAECSNSICKDITCDILPKKSLSDVVSTESLIIDTVQKFIKCRYSAITFNVNSVLNTDGFWKGDFEANAFLWGIAHITYFAESGWNYGDNNTDDDYISFCSESGDHSVVFVNDSSRPRKYSICIKNIDKSDKPIHCVETKGSANGSRYTANWFRVVDKILPCKKGYGDLYNVEVKPFSVMTCTTLPIDEINGTDTFEYSRIVDDLENNSLCFEKNNDIFSLWDIKGNFEINSESDKTYIEQTEIHENISDKELASTIFGSGLLCNYRLTAVTEFSDNDKNNFTGIGICCDKNGNIGYALRIYPNGYYETINSEGLSKLSFSEKISASSSNCLEIIIDYKEINYKINGETVCSSIIGKTPQAVSGYGALLSAYKRNTFSNVKIEQNDKNVLFCQSHDCFCEDFKYTDGWKKNGNSDTAFTNQTSVSTDKPNQSFEFEFYGERAALLGATENLRIKIEIDESIVKAGEAAKRNSDSYEAFFITERLENSIHRLKLTVLSGKLKFDSAQTYRSNSIMLPTVTKKIQKRKQKARTLKKSTILIGAGLAVAGAGMFFMRKKLKNRKNGSES